MKHRLLLCLLTLCTALLFCACDNTPTPEFTYSEEYVQIREPAGNGWLHSGTLQITESDGIRYAFLPSIPASMRTVIIDLQKQLCDALSDADLPADGMTLCILPDTACRVDTETQTVYLPLQPLGTTEHIRTVLSLLLTPDTSHGYLYALADHIAAQLSWTRDALPSPDAAVFASNPTLLQLGLPCFLPEFVTTDEIAACRALSVSLLRTMEDPFAGEAGFLCARNAYAKENGIAFSPSAVRFSSGGSACPLTIHTEYLTVLRTAVYTTYTGSMEPALRQMNDPTVTLAEMYAFFDALDEDLRSMQEKHLAGADLSAARYDRPVITLTDGSFSYNFTGETREVQTPSLYYVQYSYAMYLFFRDLVRGADYEDWHGPTYAYHLSLGEMFTRRKIAADNDAAHREYLENMIGEAFDTPEDEIRFINTMLRLDAVGTDDADENLSAQYRAQTAHAALMTELKTTYRGAVSFGDYVARRFGTAVLRDCMCNPAVTEHLTGMTLDALVDAWIAQLLQTAEPIS